MKERRTDGVNGFESAAVTDKVIAMMITDAEKGASTLADGVVVESTPTRRPRRRLWRPRQLKTRRRFVMDRLLFGDNQFFGVNHMSEEKARAQAMRFQDIACHHRGARRGLREGVRTFMCTTHDRIAEVCDHFRANSDRYPDFMFYPCMPYAHKYANAVTENGMLGAVQRFLPDEGLMDAAMRGRQCRWPRRTSKAITHAADRRGDEDVPGLSTPVIFLQNVVVDLLLGLGFKDAFRIFADHVRSRYGAEPGFITMNMPAAARRAGELRIDNPIVCANINKIGFRMCGGIEAYEDALRERRFRAIAMSVFASGAIPPRRRSSGYARSPTSSRSCSAPRGKANIRSTRELVSEYWAS